MHDSLPAWPDAGGAARARALFRETLGGDPDGVWASPGRVNVIGEHVDYNGGPCLPIALPHRTFVAVRRTGLPTDASHRVRLVSAQDPTDVWTGTLADLTPGRASGWVAYAGGPAWALAADGLAIGGFDAAIDSNVPTGAGLSSSAALECAVALALDELNGHGLAADDAGRARLAAACVRAENEVAGAPTGGMDQAASLRTAAGHALLLDNLDHSVRQIPFELTALGLTLLVIDTQARHALVDGQYAARRDTCEAAASVLGVAKLGQVGDTAAALASLPDATMRRRVRHVLTEIERTNAAAKLLSEGRVREIGPLLDASHASLRDDYEVSCAELDVAVEAARDAGALGARMTGGGFGGSAIALVEDAHVAAVTDAVAAAFARRGFTPPRFLLAIAGAPGGRVD